MHGTAVHYNDTVLDPVRCLLSGHSVEFVVVAVIQIWSFSNKYAVFVTLLGTLYCTIRMCSNTISARLRHAGERVLERIPAFPIQQRPRLVEGLACVLHYILSVSREAVPWGEELLEGGSMLDWDLLKETWPWRQEDNWPINPRG